MSLAMAVRNYLIDGGSATGKTSVCNALRRRGFSALNGDRDLIPDRGRLPLPPGCENGVRDAEARAAWRHDTHFWDMTRVRSRAANRQVPVSFFCGGARNHAAFADLFEGIFILEIDRETLEQRLATRSHGEFGATPAERRLILRLHDTGQGLPRPDWVIDATAPIEDVVADILARCRQAAPLRKTLRT